MATAGCDNLAVASNPLFLCEASELQCEVPIVDSWYFRVKAMFDRLVGLVLLVPALPLIGFIVLLVRSTSPGPGIYRQTRVGKGGRIFTMFKIRSMRRDAEGLTGPTWAGIVRDPRVTPLGHLLRRLHLDELPQLFNVVCGHMSLVGPRPERPEFVGLLTEQIPGYLERLSVRPGITGLAQVNLPPDTDLDSVRRKLILDCEYIRTAGLLFDLRIMLCTLLRVLGFRGGRAVRLLALSRKVELPANAAPLGGAAGGGPTPLESVAAAGADPAAESDAASEKSATSRRVDAPQCDPQDLKETVSVSQPNGHDTQTDLRPNSPRRARAR